MINVKLSEEKCLLYPTEGAFVAGLIFGWASRLEDNSASTKNVINDMKDFAKILAVRSGVTLVEEKIERRN